MEKRAVLAIVLSLLVVVVWSMWFAPSPPSPPDVTPPEPVAEQTPSEPDSRAPVPPGLPPRVGATGSPATGASAAEVTVDTGVAQLVLSGRGAGVKAVRLLNYHTTLDEGAPPIVVEPVTDATAMPLETRLVLGGRTVSLGDVVFDTSASDMHLSASQPEAEVTFRGTMADGTVVHRTYRFTYDSYVFAVNTRVDGLQPAAEDQMALIWGPGLRHNRTEDTQRRGQTEPLPRSLVGGKIYHTAPKEVNEGRVDQGKVSWAALGDTYFTAVLIPQNPPAESAVVRRVREDALEVGVQTPLHDHTSQTVQVYVGPKSHQVLKQVDPSLGKLIDLGFFSPLARPMLQLLIAVNSWIHNYGVTIILVTILIKIVLWPLTNTSHKSMRAMQKLQPKMKELQTMYKDDRQGLNRAMMNLYREQKVNPMGGCLPMVLQIPVFFAFYNALLYSIELRHAPFICWDTPIFWIGRGICDLSVHDPSYITPLLMGASMFLQQRMTPVTTADPMQAKMMQFMPLMFLFFFLKAPAGLVIYWLFNNLLTIAQQFIINRMSEQAEPRAEVANP
jgi:YidC/Oxa1 family membrane protein insertase